MNPNAFTPGPKWKSADDNVMLLASGDFAEARFPELASSRPVRPAFIVGRDKELDDIAGRVRDRWVVNVVGPAGVGKTTVASEVIWRVSDRYDETLWIPLDQASPRSDLWEFIHSRASLSATPDRSAEEAVILALRQRNAALVIDNCEHRLTAVRSLVRRVLAECPRIALLLTSRERLPLSQIGENVELRGLQVPPDSAVNEADIKEYPSVALFLHTSKTVSPLIQFDTAAIRDVEQICRNLDGLPLAIELAASYANVLSARETLNQLGRNLGLLEGNGSERHDSLTLAVDWSYQLLDQDLQRLWCELSIFNGGADLEAIENVCSRGALPLAVLVRQLWEKSMVQIETHENSSRFLLLNSLRHYASSTLDQTGSKNDIETRRDQYFDSWIAVQEPLMRKSDQHIHIQETTVEYGNLLSSMRHSRMNGDGRIALGIAGNLWRFWRVRGLYGDGLEMLDDLLETFVEPTKQRSRALCAAGNLAFWRGDLNEALSKLNEAYEVAVASNDVEWGQPFALLISGMVCLEVDDEPTEAETRLGRAMSAWSALGDSTGIYLSLFGLAACARLRGDHKKALALEASCSDALVQHDDLWAAASCLYGLGTRAEQDGDPASAEELFSASLPIWRLLSDAPGLAKCLVSLGRLGVSSNFRHSLELLKESLLIQVLSPDTARASDGLFLAALCCDSAGLYEDAVKLSTASIRSRPIGASRRESRLWEESVKSKISGYDELGNRVMSVVRQGENLISIGPRGDIDIIRAVKEALNITDRLIKESSED